MRKFLLLAAIFVLATGAVFAQGLTTGTLEGFVAGEDGAPVAGAVVTAVGPQGAQTQVTNDKGYFVFRGLLPGTYNVKAEADGYSTIIQSGVVVYISRRTQLPFSLPKGIKQEITVTSEAPMVDMKSTTTGQSVKIDSFAPYVPLGRSLQATVAISPGVADGGGTGTANASISGSSGLENAYFVDGVNITNSGYGALGAYSIVYGSLGTGVTYEFLEEVQVKTGGFEAEFGQAGGGVVNSVVKSGTNEFTVDAAWYEQVGSLEGGRRTVELTPNVANRIETSRRDLAIASGGPIIKDRLFYFLAYNPVKTESDFRLVSGDSTVGYDLNNDGTEEYFGVGQTIQGGRVPGSVTRTRTIDNYAGKLAYFLTPNHRFEATFFGDPSDGDVGPQAPTSFLRVLADPAANPNASASATGLDWGGDQYSLKYHGVWSPNFFTEVQFAHKRNTFKEVGPGTTFRSIFNTVENNTSGGAGFFEDLEDKTDQFSIKFTNVIGPVEIKYGYQMDDIDWRQPRQYSGPTYEAWLPRLTGNLVDTDGDGTGDTTEIAGDGGLNDSSYLRLTSGTGASLDFFDSDGDGTADTYNVTRTGFGPIGEFTNAKERNAFVQATWDVTPNLTVKGGLRWTEQELTGSGNYTLPVSLIGGVMAAGSTTYSPKHYTFDSEIAPRFGITWDVRGDGRHKIYGNYGEYYQRVPSDLAVRQFSNEVGLENEEFFDADLTMPVFNSTCALADGTIVGCHLPQGTGAEPGVILDGSQQTRDFIEGIGLNFSDATNGEPSKLPYTKEWLVGYAWEINDYTSFEARYIDRELGRVLEDVQFASNEQIWNQFFGPLTPMGEIFPGHGSSSFGAYVLANPGTNVNQALFPSPVRDYKALELIFQRRFHNSWMVYANYRLGRLRGNYEGSFRNDNGQSDPFITSLFDLPAASLLPDGSTVVSGTLAGQYTNGPLNTDRRHIVNAFVSKDFDNGLNLGVRMTLQSGQPRFPLFAHPTYRNSGEIPGVNPTYWWLVLADFDPTTDSDGDGVVDNDIDGFGVFLDTDATQSTFADQDVNRDGIADTNILYASGPRLWSYDVVKRDYFGRNPWTYSFDVHLSYDFDLGNGKLTALLDIFNFFSDTEWLGFDNRVELRPGTPNPNYLKPTSYQAPRQYRLGVRYHW
ncbi:MAG: carboxypeptidase regulatory-like domain-containing protein [Acidobacteriota bacterium]|nr:carboxypeptidase regulatory-like domain-containing protein [Acidobacteriota bacterium]MDQ7086562.1 carboxypeptidase regulatory-like domain-containing protein [Acidobacteriota bacterium]